jgi:hypothetical protein
MPEIAYSRYPISGKTKKKRQAPLKEWSRQTLNILPAIRVERVENTPPIGFPPLKAVQFWIESSTVLVCELRFIEAHYMRVAPFVIS